MSRPLAGDYVFLAHLQFLEEHGILLAQMVDAASDPVATGVVAEANRVNRHHMRQWKRERAAMLGRWA